MVVLRFGSVLIWAAAMSDVVIGFQPPAMQRHRPINRFSTSELSMPSITENYFNFYKPTALDESAGKYVYPNLYDEAIPMLWASKLVYSFAKLVEEYRKGALNLTSGLNVTFPEVIKAPPTKSTADILVEEDQNSGALDLDKSEKIFTPSISRRDKLQAETLKGIIQDVKEGKHGWSFNQILECVKDNKEHLKEIESDWEYVAKIIGKIQAIEGADKGSDCLFLEKFKVLNAATECVFGIIKDTRKKRIIVVFRGSTQLSMGEPTRDWDINLEAQVEEMKAPELLRNKVRGRVFVHRGFHEYLFDNKRAKGEQSYVSILDDLRDIMSSVDEGYKIYVTGHSLGAALSTLLAFKLAAEDEEWIPKPISCINYASPLLGTDGFRAAFFELEKMGLVRCLRINNKGDVVPTVPPFSLEMRSRLMKHVGINLRLTRNSFILSHPSTNWFGIVNASRNSFLKLWRRINYYHGLPLHEGRMDRQKKNLQEMSINDLYANKTIFDAGVEL